MSKISNPCSFNRSLLAIGTRDLPQCAEDMRIISMQNGGNVGQVLERLIRGVKAIQSKAPFSRDDRLGWLTFCPTNLVYFNNFIQSFNSKKFREPPCAPQFTSNCPKSAPSRSSRKFAMISSCRSVAFMASIRRPRAVFTTFPTRLGLA